jgi:hypothetical protein
MLPDFRVFAQPYSTIQTLVFQIRQQLVLLESRG